MNYVKKILETVETIFEATKKVIDKKKNGERASIKDIAIDVAKMLSMSESEVKEAVGFFLHNTEEYNVGFNRAGKGGGWIKGNRPKTIVKVNDKSNKTKTVEIPSEEDRSSNLDVSDLLEEDESEIEEDKNIVAA